MKGPCLHPAAVSCLAFSLAPFNRVRCHVASSPVERSVWHGTEDGAKLMLSEKKNPQHTSEYGEYHAPMNPGKDYSSV